MLIFRLYEKLMPNAFTRIIHIIRVIKLSSSQMVIDNTLIIFQAPRLVSDVLHPHDALPVPRPILRLQKVQIPFLHARLLLLCQHLMHDPGKK